jgi:hypothetical protein
MARAMMHGPSPITEAEDRLRHLGTTSSTTERTDPA